MVIQGARQVGKTWVMRHFGEQHFKKIASIEDKIAHAEKVALLNKQIYELQKRMYKENRTYALS